MEPDRLLDGLNEAQRRAVTSSVVPLCILAGAGSGKTRVLTRRIAYRAATGQHDAQRVLALTFTRKAAGELSGRLRQLGLRDSVVAGTFHAVAYAQLRARWADRRVTPPTLLDRKVGFVARLLPATPRGGRGGRDSTPLDVVAEIEWAKARLIGPEQYPSAAKAANRKPSLEPRQIAAVYERYEQEKRNRRMVDFDDLLSLCVRDLTNDPTFAEAQRWRYRHFFVDEFQDVNRLQHSLLTAWMGGRNDLCVVGDPNQAIYSWNGADARYLLDFEERHGGGEVVRLTENYRSSPEILTVANAVLGGGLAAARARERDAGAGGALHANRPAGPVPSVRGLPDDVAEAQAIARAVRDHHAPGTSWRSQAILVRTNAQTAIIEEALTAGQIPFRVKGGSGLLELPEIKRALAALRSAGDDFAVALTDLETAAARSRRRGDDAWIRVATDVAPAPGPAGGADPEAADASEVAATDATMSIAEQERLANLEALVRLGHDYAALDTSPTTSGFLAWLNATTRADQPDREGDAVEIVTFHAAKGLEWPIVHLAGAEDGFVPISYAKAPAEIAEERRLFYVALTRAERELHLTWARTRTFGTRLAERAPSPYLNQVEAARRALARGEVPDDWATHFAQARAAGTTITFDDGPDPRVPTDPTGAHPGADTSGPRAAPPRPPGFERGRARRTDHHIAGALLDLDEADHPLFDALVEWRAHTARAGAVSPTVVLPDGALLALARHRPTDRDALVALGGIGPVKVARYGDRLVELVAEHPRAP